MPEFVVFAIAVSMCVICFAGGFVAALVLRIAGNTALPNIGTFGRVERPAPSRPETLQPSPVATPPAPAFHGHSIPTPQAENGQHQQSAAAVRPATPLPMRHPTYAARSEGFAAPQSPAPQAPAPQSPPAAKVFLFGDPQVEAVAPALAPVPAAAQPNTWATQHVAPQHSVTAEIDLLPRPLHARSARRR